MLCSHRVGLLALDRDSNVESVVFAALQFSSLLEQEKIDINSESQSAEFILKSWGQWYIYVYQWILFHNLKRLLKILWGKRSHKYINIISKTALSIASLKPKQWMLHIYQKTLLFELEAPTWAVCPKVSIKRHIPQSTAVIYCTDGTEKWGWKITCPPFLSGNGLFKNYVCQINKPFLFYKSCSVDLFFHVFFLLLP